MTRERHLFPLEANLFCRSARGHQGLKCCHLSMEIITTFLNAASGKKSRFYLYVSNFRSSSGCVGGCCVASVPWSPLHRISLPNKQEAQGGRDLLRWLCLQDPHSAAPAIFFHLFSAEVHLAFLFPIRVYNTASPTYWLSPNNDFKKSLRLVLQWLLSC